MHRLTPIAIVALIVIAYTPVRAQLPDAKQVAQERARAEIEVPQLAALLELKPGMTVADVGAGFGASTVIEGAAAATNLPPDCCDAIFMRDVYHHVTNVDAFNKSVLASLKPGGRFAVLDFVPQPGSRLPDGVAANRGGHGIPTSIVVDEFKAAGFTHVRTVDLWPPDQKDGLFLVLFRKP